MVPRIECECPDEAWLAQVGGAPMVSVRQTSTGVAQPPLTSGAQLQMNSESFSHWQT